MNTSAGSVRRKRRWYIIIAGLIVLALVTAGPALVRLATDLASFGGPGSSPSLEEISRVTSLRFPRSAVLINSLDASFQDTMLQAKIEMDRADVDEFIASLPSPCMISTRDRQRVTNHIWGSLSPAWWDPDSARKFKSLSIRHDRKSGGFVLILMLIKLDDPDRAVVYLDYGVN